MVVAAWRGDSKPAIMDLHYFRQRLPLLASTAFPWSGEQGRLSSGVLSSGLALRLWWNRTASTFSPATCDCRNQRPLSLIFLSRRQLQETGNHGAATANFSSRWLQATAASASSRRRRLVCSGLPPLFPMSRAAATVKLSSVDLGPVFRQACSKQRRQASKMVKFLKPNKAVILLQGRYAGKKAVIVKSFDDDTRDLPYGHCLVTGSPSI
nr:60S ribosomal protein L27 [Ipomoea batatas]